MKPRKQIRDHLWTILETVLSFSLSRRQITDKLDRQLDDRLRHEVNQNSNISNVIWFELRK